MQTLLFSFEGRINRAKFWIISIAVGIIHDILSYIIYPAVWTESDPATALESVGLVRGILLLVLFVVVVWIGLAVAVKRWHDRDKSGWWVLIVLVPVVGVLWYLIECGFLRGTPGPNRYGPDPLVRALAQS
jgi:uncharacterized membrane protein YhaH (DUF805 family)